MSKTTIQIDSKTLDKLKKLKITRRDTYDEIINRIIDNKNKMENE